MGTVIAQRPTPQIESLVAGGQVDALMPIGDVEGIPGAAVQIVVRVDQVAAGSSRVSARRVDWQKCEVTISWDYIVTGGGYVLVAGERHPLKGQTTVCPQGDTVYEVRVHNENDVLLHADRHAVQVNVPDAIVNSGGVRVPTRTGPGPNFPRSGVLSDGDTVDVLGTNPARTWVQVRLPSGARRWVQASMLQFVGVQLDDLPVVGAGAGVTPSASPEPTVTPAEEGPAEQQPARPRRPRRR